LLHDWGVLFDGGKGLGRGGIDFAWNVHVVKIGTAGQKLAWAAILPRSTTVGTAGRYGLATVAGQSAMLTGVLRPVRIVRCKIQTSVLRSFFTDGRCYPMPRNAEAWHVGTAIDGMPGKLEPACFASPIRVASNSNEDQ
jgi:hypothetical protein